MAQFLRDLKKALYTGTDKWETSYDPNLLQDGTYMKNLAIARKTVEAEIGHEKWKEIHEPNIVYDTLLCTLVPLASWICMYFTWNYPLSSPVFWVAALIHGWLILGSFLLYHDVLAHRMAFGVWGSWLMGLWVSSHGMLANGLHAFWGMRHCMTHHKRTFEKVDCDLSGHDMSSRITRSIFFIGALRQFIRLQFWRDMDRKHNSNKIPEWYPGDIGKVKEIQYFIDGWNRVLRNTIYIVMAYYYPLDTFKMLLIPQTFMGFPDMVRYVFEHAEHDRNNPFWHATPYQSTTFVRTLWFCEMGDCHAIHHLFPKVPMYRMHLATKYINPIIRKHGVPDRNSFWEIMYGYFILGLPHGQRWDNFRNWKLTKTN